MREQLNAPMGWDNQTELQAQTADLLHILIRLTQAAHMENPPRGDIYRTPRPYDNVEEPEMATLSNLSDFLKE